MKNLSFLLIILVSFSCAENKTGRPIELDLSKGYVSNEHSQLIDSITSIKLETREECLIGKINQILKDDTLLFILDKHQKNIFIFSESGKFIEKINRIGKGDGEYISTTAFCVDTQKKMIYLLDDMQQKILKYDYNSTYYGKLQFNYEDIIRSIAISSNGNLIFFTPDYMSRGRDGVWEVDKEGKFVKELKRVNPQHKLVFIPFPYYSNCEGKLSFYDGFTNKVFSIKDEELICDFHFDLKQRIPEKYLKNEDGIQHRGTGNYYINNHIAETREHYFLQFQSTELGKKTVFYSKKTGRIFSGEILESKIDKEVSTEIFSFNNDAFLRVVWKDNTNSNPNLQLVYLNKNL